jgi:tetratricopeptide (TPR) repeat protein
MEAAIECKRNLRLRQQIDPWLYELAATYTNNWKIQHAVAYGFIREDRRWEAIQCMDRAFRHAQDGVADDVALGQIYLDYIDYLLSKRQDSMYELQVKTPGISEVSYQEALDGLSKIIVTDPAGKQVECDVRDLYELPDWVRDDPELIMRIEQANPSYHRKFYDLPDSYESSANDGELIRWLIENRPSDGYGNNWLQHPWTMADYAVLIAGSHINLPCGEDYSLKKYSYIPSEQERALLASLKDNESIIWGSGSVSSRIIKLPDDYCFIADYSRRADQGDQYAAETLGNIFINRCRLERAARYFERAGEFKKVRSIRGNQGTFLVHSPYPEGTSASVDFIYRNAEEVTFEIYPLTVETNLLARLITEDMLGSELNLLRGVPATYQNTTQTNRFRISDEPVASWTHRLSPRPDHLDRLDVIKLPELEAGNYLLRAIIRDGNRVETVLHVYDTLLYRADSSIRADYGYKTGRLYMLCDAMTGRPLPNEDLHFFDLQGKAIRLGKKWVDCRYWVKRYKRGVTNKDRVYISDEINVPETVLAKVTDPLPLALREASVELDVRDEAAYDYWRDEDYEEPEIFMISDRPMYRPGDTGYIKFWAPVDPRYYSSYYCPAVTLLKDKYEIPLTASQVDSDGDACRDAYGGVDFSFTIPTNAPLGK